MYTMILYIFFANPDRKGLKSKKGKVGTNSRFSNEKYVKILYSKNKIEKISILLFELISNSSSVY